MQHHNGKYTCPQDPHQVQFHCVKVPYDECVGVILNIFFDSTAKTLVIYNNNNNNNFNDKKAREAISQ